MKLNRIISRCFQGFYLSALTIAALVTGPIVTSNNASAEVIQIPLASQAGELKSMARPQRGMTKASVSTEFGKPLVIGPAVGDPPITRWEYQDYYVFFEHEHVIHSVLKHRPTNLNQN